MIEMISSEEEIVDLLNTIISAQSASKRIIVWHGRLIQELKKLEGWLKYESCELHKQHLKASPTDDC